VIDVARKRRFGDVILEEIGDKINVRDVFTHHIIKQKRKR